MNKYVFSLLILLDIGYVWVKYFHFISQPWGTGEAFQKLKLKLSCFYTNSKGHASSFSIDLQLHITCKLTRSRVPKICWIFVLCFHFIPTAVFSLLPRLHSIKWPLVYRARIFSICRVSASVQGQEWPPHFDAMHSQFILFLHLRGYILFSYLYMRSRLFG